MSSFGVSISVRPRAKRTRCGSSVATTYDRELPLYRDWPIAVVANHWNVHGLVARNNVIRDSLATAMYFGCHDGITCSITGLLVEGNLIQGVTAPDPEIGYGIQVKLNSSAIIRSNVVL